MMTKRVKRQKMPYGIIKSNRVPVNRTVVSKQEYRELRDYARKHGVRIGGFKNYYGSIETIKEMIDDAEIVIRDFPAIINGRKSLTIINADSVKEEDFATTEHHIIWINGNLYSNVEYLSNEYNNCVAQGKFVKGTTYRSILFHELGHVVSNIYHIDPMQIAKSLLKGFKPAEIDEYIANNVSLYATEYKDGREYISECFSAYYGKVGNDFAERFVILCRKYVEAD